MANLNEKTEVINGRNPVANNNEQSFAKNEAVEAVLWVKNGKKIDSRCLRDEEFSGEIVGGFGIKDFTVKSDRDYLNALVVDGGVTVLLNPDIELAGFGCSDFTCKGTGVLAVNGAKVDIRGGIIETNGVTRAATIATEGATLKVFDARLATHGGPFPEGYKPVIGPGMMEPPYPLGFGGNCRTHLSMDNSESYFYNCDIYAAGWACLSTDSGGGYTYVEANDSVITMAGNGYIVYADNAAHVVLNRCEIASGNVFGVLDGNSTILFRGVIGRCDGYGFLVHGGMTELADIGTIRILDSNLVSSGPLFRCKSTNTDIYVKGGSIICKGGVLLESMLTDDEFYYKFRSHTPNDYGMQACFEDMTLHGDILVTDPERKHCVNLVNTVLTGAVTGGVHLHLADSSQWTATADSDIVLLGNADGIDAPKGVTVTAKSDALPSHSTALPSGGILTITK